jgi:hypothetical protein
MQRVAKKSTPPETPYYILYIFGLYVRPRLQSTIRFRDIIYSVNSINRFASFLESKYIFLGLTSPLRHCWLAGWLPEQSQRKRCKNSDSYNSLDISPAYLLYTVLVSQYALIQLSRQPARFRRFEILRGHDSTFIVVVVFEH